MQNKVLNSLNNSPNIPQLFSDFSKANTDKLLWLISDQTRDPNAFERANYQEAFGSVCKLAQYLDSLGVKAGDRVAIISNSRPEWLIADMAILAVGGVVVSVYQSLLAHDIAYLLFDSGAQIVFAENQEQVNKLHEVISKPWEMAGTEDRDLETSGVQLKKIISFERVPEHDLVEDLYDIYQKTSETGDLPPVIQQIKSTDLASIVYTSGTTGPPKGVMQTHGNHLANIRQAFAGKLVSESDRLFIMLPLAHSFAKLMGYIGMLTGAELAFPAVGDLKSSKADPKRVSLEMSLAGATIIPVVPRLLEKLQDGVLALSKKSGFSFVLMRFCLKIAARHQAFLKQKRKIPSLLFFWYGVFKPLREKISHKLFGSRFKYAISGGAKLPMSVSEFFSGLEIEVLEGYGLTESCVATNANPSGKNRIGTVGPVLDKDIELRISDEGEILFKGPNITSGYWHRPTATANSWDKDGWFHTGDLGEVDGEGYLSITGRKKDLLVTSGGKKVSPERIEGLLKKSSYISQAVLAGDGKQYCVAIISLNEPEILSWLKSINVPPPKEIHSDTGVYDLIDRHIVEINKDLASFETIKKFYIAPEDFTIENGFLTPTLKVKRNLVVKAYAKEIERLYSSK